MMIMVLFVQCGVKVSTQTASILQRLSLSVDHSSEYHLPPLIQINRSGEPTCAHDIICCQGGISEQWVVPHRQQTVAVTDPNTSKHMYIMSSFIDQQEAPLV